MKAFENVLKSMQSLKPTNTKITTKEYSVNVRCNEIRNKIKINGKIKFEDLFDIISKEYVVVTFLAILSMAKKQEIIIKQNNNFDGILIKAKEALW